MARKQVKSNGDTVIVQDGLGYQPIEPIFSPSSRYLGWNYTFDDKGNSYDYHPSTYVQSTFAKGNNTYTSPQEGFANYLELMQKGQKPLPVFQVIGANGRPQFYRITGTYNGPVEAVTEEPVKQKQQSNTQKPTTRDFNKANNSTQKRHIVVPEQYREGLALVKDGKTFYDFGNYSPQDIISAIETVTKNSVIGNDNTYYISPTIKSFTETERIVEPSVVSVNPTERQHDTDTQKSTNSSTSETSSSNLQKISLRDRLRNIGDNITSGLYNAFDRTAGIVKYVIDDIPSTIEEIKLGDVERMHVYRYGHQHKHIWKIDPELADLIKKELQNSYNENTATTDTIYIDQQLTLPNDMLNDSTFYDVYRLTQEGAKYAPAHYEIVDDGFGNVTKKPVLYKSGDLYAAKYTKSKEFTAVNAANTRDQIQIIPKNNNISEYHPSKHSNSTQIISPYKFYGLDISDVKKRKRVFEQKRNKAEESLKEMIEKGIISPHVIDENGEQHLDAIKNHYQSWFPQYTYFPGEYHHGGKINYLEFFRK